MAVGDRYLGEKQNTVAVSAVATLPTIAANGLFTAIALLHARRCTCMRVCVCVCVCVYRLNRRKTSSLYYIIYGRGPGTHHCLSWPTKTRQYGGVNVPAIFLRDGTWLTREPPSRFFVGCIINFVVSTPICMFQDSVPAGSYNDPFLSSVIPMVTPTWCHRAN